MSIISGTCTIVIGYMSIWLFNRYHKDIINLNRFMIVIWNFFNVFKNILDSLKWAGVKN